MSGELNLNAPNLPRHYTGALSLANINTLGGNKEIRDHVIHHAMVSDITIEVTSIQDHHTQLETLLWRLPEALQYEAVQVYYRENKFSFSSMVLDTPIKVTNIIDHDNQLRAMLNQLDFVLHQLPDRKASRDEAEKLFYTKNTFWFPSTKMLRAFLYRRPRVILLMTKLSVDVNQQYVSNARSDDLEIPRLIWCIGELQHLEEIGIGIDEPLMVWYATRINPCFQRQRVVPNKIPRSMNLSIYRIKGISELRNLRIPVTFAHHNFPFVDPAVRGHLTLGLGPIPGGILETVIAKEMRSTTPAPAQPEVKKGKRKAISQSVDEDTKYMEDVQSTEQDESSPDVPGPMVAQIPFRFRDLPRELRELVYAELLQFQDEICISDLMPSSAFISPSILKDPSAEIPISVLNIFFVDKTMYKEAGEYFFKWNKFIFYSPLQATSCFTSLSPLRKSWFRKISLWHKVGMPKEGQVHFWDIALKRLPIELPYLTDLEVVYDGELSATYNSHSLRVIPGAAQLTAMSRQGVKVKLRCNSADLELHHREIQAKPDGPLSTVAEDVNRGLRNFEAGLPYIARVPGTPITSFLPI